MKIAVVKPPSNARRIYPALGLGYIAAALKQDNYDVEYIDACLVDFSLGSLDGKKKVDSPINWEVIERHLTDKCKDADIAIIGGSFTADINNSFKIVNIFKRINKECKTVLGGTHSCALTKQVMEECDNVDFVVRGEGEHIARLLAKIISGKGDIHGIKGLSYRDAGGRICVSEKSGPIMDLDTLLFPARELMPMQEYRDIWKRFSLGSAPGMESDPAGLIFSSRGCFGKCIFCASNEISNRTMRFRSPESVISEVKHLIERYNITNITFLDDTFTVNKRRCIEICDYLAGTKLPWYCWSRIDTISPELLVVMKKSGCKLLNFGLESGDDRMLSVMKKGITLKQIEEGLKIVKESGIKFVASFTIGHPGETKETIKKTVRLAKKFGGFAAGIYRITPYPGTPLYEEALKNNWIQKVGWDSYDDTSKEEPFYIPPGWDKDEFHKVYLKAQREVINYYRIKRILRLGSYH